MSEHKQDAELVVGLLGCGGVGSALVKQAAIHPAVAGRVRIKRALVRDPGRVRPGVPAALLTADPEAVVGDPEIDLVVEVMGGLEPARSLLGQALAAGKAVVTANKRVMAEAGSQLRESARRAALPLGFEATVGAGLPVVRAAAGLAGDRVLSVRAVLNGTTNYILDRMAEGLEPDAALAEAQARGYAEPDPGDDLSGRDAAYKLVILTALLFGWDVHPDDIPTRGLAGLTAAEVQAAHRQGRVVRLLAAISASPVPGDGPVLSVGPSALPREDPLARLRGSENGVEIRGEAVGTLFLSGPGAGHGTTAAALLADILAAAPGLARSSVTRPGTARIPARIPREGGTGPGRAAP